MLLEIQVGMDAFFGEAVVVATRRQIVCAIPAQHPVLIDGNRRQSGDRVVVRSDQALINVGRAAVQAVLHLADPGVSQLRDPRPCPKFCAAWQHALAIGGVETVVFPPLCPPFILSCRAIRPSGKQRAE